VLRRGLMHNYGKTNRREPREHRGIRVWEVFCVSFEEIGGKKWYVET
jgi:hypothetical protein